MAEVPQAADFPRGATVLSTDGTDRSQLRWSAAFLTVAVFGLGLGTGYLVFRPKRRRRAA